ncbi:uncharacterized protein [Apostichopus japonicus]|uniref:uncharacterized protein isoform X3 n=1 Tax=Stichopus japonicus TaxID=307972 RepID=UPI003AB69E78
MTFVVNANYSGCCTSDFECRNVNSRCSFEYNWPQFDLPTCAPVPPMMSLKINENTLKQSYYWVPQFEPILITCFAWDAMPKVNLSWVTNGRDRIYTQTNVTEGDTSTYNSTSLLHYIPTEENSSISCYGNSVISSEYHVEVSLYTYVPPTMSLKINEITLKQSYYWVPQNELMVITCFAWDAMPKVNLSWVTNGRDRIYTQLKVTEGDAPTYNSTSLLSYIPTQENSSISCYGNSVISSEYHVEVSLYTYVFPELYITLNGERIEKEYVNSGENLNVTCHADGARPVSSLSFNDRNEVVTELPPITNTSTSISFLLMKRLEQENITCTSTQRREDESDLTRFVTVTVTVPEKSTTQPEKPTTQPDSPTKDPPSSGFDYLQWIIPSIATLLTCFVFVCIYKITTKIRALMSVTFSTDADTTHLKLNSLPADQSLAHYSSQVYLQNKQKSALPSIPRDEISYNHFSSSESIYYSAEKESTSKDRIFSENEFCILSTIKVGTIYNRWMGTIKTPNKFAVLTTIAEGVMEKQINWDAFVKRTLDLPTTDHLTRIEGIAVEKTTLYLVTERTVCETLKSRLTFDPSSQSSTFSVSDVMKHVAAILEGIKCLQSYGFLHPGLSTKKILYTNEGICKLYDFCLAEDAPKVVMLKKTQMNTVSFNQLPPESFFRNEYTAESDVWSTAVVIWEILSSGETPFPVDEDIQPGQYVNAPMLKWPQRCFQLRNLVLFDCWSQTCSLRPSIHYLKESFRAVFETLRENSFYEIPRSGLYMPMSGVTNYS